MLAVTDGKLLLDLWGVGASLLKALVMVVHLVEWLDGQVLWVQNLWVPSVLNFNIQSRGCRWFLAMCTDSTQNGHNSGDGCFGSTSRGMVRCCGEGSDGPKLLSGGKKGGSGHVWCNPLLLLLLLLPGPLLKYPPVSPYCTDTGYNHFCCTTFKH